MKRLTDVTKKWKRIHKKYLMLISTSNNLSSEWDYLLVHIYTIRLDRANQLHLEFVMEVLWLCLIIGIQAIQLCSVNRLTLHNTKFKEILPELNDE